MLLFAVFSNKKEQTEQNILKYYFRSKSYNFLPNMIMSVCSYLHSFFWCHQNRKEASSSQETISCCLQSSDEDKMKRMNKRIQHLKTETTTDLCMFSVKQKSRQERDIVTYDTLCLFWQRRDNKQGDSSFHWLGNVGASKKWGVWHCTFQTEATELADKD